jgi:hypothetical protein
MRKTLVILASVAVVAGCSSDHKVTPPMPTTTTVTTPGTDVPPPRNAQERAVQACAEAVPYPAKLVSSFPTTVGDIRNVTIGTVAPSTTQAFPSRNATAFGAWCWIQRGKNFDVYEVTPGVAAVLAAHLVNFNPRDAHGAPAIP